MLRANASTKIENTNIKRDEGNNNNIYIISKGMRVSEVSSTELSCDFSSTLESWETTIRSYYCETKTTRDQ